ncbi:hypothetical protein GS462_25540 [Rhodococcus hoagii]|uniref:hypothetical protein n=1 Tax=Rhodococcus hoagii TaxID=43767 RepID=UPI00117B53A0|nr:hypothetical protein [Prescottella equi]MBM4527288.1 hypothetical protein [Prescottella equi]MBM4554377.1 hypothetical protein [Prescottella equi]MBM4653712.1 hypothetical protein [Prescottella equi]MBM4685826.1 hypothetical protein [Prescottella equi]
MTPASTIEAIGLTPSSQAMSPGLALSAISVHNQRDRSILLIAIPCPSSRSFPGVSRSRQDLFEQGVGAVDN